MKPILEPYESLNQLVDELDWECKALESIENMDSMLQEFFKTNKPALAQYIAQQFDNGWPEFADKMVAFVSYGDVVFHAKKYKLYYHLTKQEYIEIVEQDVT